MVILFFPFLILFFLTTKVVYFYAACITLVPILIGPLFEHIFDFTKEVGGSDGFQTIIKWVAFGGLAICVYFLMHS